MKIDGNEIEKRAMEAFHAGDRELGRRIQDEFIEELRAYCADHDHCSCKEPCKFHGKCLECVALHRAHRDHLPNCFHDMVNARLAGLAALTERTLTGEK